MKQVNESTTKTSLISEINKRAIIGLYMFLCWKLAQVILKPIDAGDEKLIMLSLVEIATMSIMVIFFDRSNIVRDINEFNCYALLTHLAYLPAFFFNVTPIYHNNAIDVLLFLVAIRLLYFGPRSENGDFSGLPVFGLLGHLRILVEEKEKSKIGRFLNHLPSILFFGASIPIWIIVARSNDHVITTTVIGLMLFIFVMAQRVHNLLESTKYKNIKPMAEIMPITLPTTATVQPVAEAVSNDIPVAVAQTAINMFSLQVIETFERAISNNEYGLTPVNLHLMRSMPEMPRPYEPPMEFDIDSQRIGALDNLAHLGKIILRQLRNELADKSNIQVFASRLPELNAAFENRFGEESNTIDVDKYAYIGSQTDDFEISDKEFFHVCEVLMMAKLRIILKNDAALLDKMNIINKIENTLDKKFWPED